MNRIFQEIAIERERQDNQWGGPEHDDTRLYFDWFTFIRGQIRRYTPQSKDLPKISDRVKAIRSRLVKIAALAVAGIESIDRQKPDWINKD